MPKTANNLSEAFLRVRDYLLDGTGDFANVSPKQKSCICFAAILAKQAKAITQEQLDMIKSIVQLRLLPHSFVSGYMRKELNVNPTMREAQKYRHEWLIKLSRKFKDKE